MSDVLYSDTESAVTVSNNEKEHRYEISVAGETAGHMGYRAIGTRRVLMHTVIYDAYRGRGLSNVLIKGILDFLCVHGNTISNYCPVVERFMRRNPEYIGLVDAKHSGTWVSTSS
ncbi:MULTISPECIES: GNAT family N-acetyltransferase [unclassified Streptomyces]|uniref:GNAT family N-acetyltransferase n=1 Tax=unclassified Streptomyces TaxID=2593676 RepID=UPI00382F686F